MLIELVWGGRKRRLKLREPCSQIAGSENLHGGNGGCLAINSQHTQHEQMFRTRRLEVA
jgi:hypothetical protein